MLNHCNVCGLTAPFIETKVNHRMARCAHCGSVERHRLLVHWLSEEGLPPRGSKILHFSPMARMAHKISSNHANTYVSSNLNGTCDKVHDMCDIDEPDNSFDLVIAVHVLEHIVDDAKAMAECHRILRPGGRAVFMVPIPGGNMGESEKHEWITAKIKDGTAAPELLEAHYGHPEHVVNYGYAGFVGLLATVFGKGWVEVVRPRQLLPTTYATQLGVKDEPIFIAEKR